MQAINLEQVRYITSEESKFESVLWFHMTSVQSEKCIKITGDAKQIKRLYEYAILSPERMLNVPQKLKLQVVE